MILTIFQFIIRKYGHWWAYWNDYCPYHFIKLEGLLQVWDHRCQACLDYSQHIGQKREEQDRILADQKAEWFKKFS